MKPNDASKRDQTLILSILDRYRKNAGQIIRRFSKVLQQGIVGI
jgi:hypothetical protein